MRIDAHHHLWTRAAGWYGWLTPDLAPIYRDYQADDLTPHLAAAGIDGTILVQAAPVVDETHFLLNVARANRFVRGVVGWVDFEDPTHLPLIEAFAADPLVKGLRPMVHDIADTDWLLRPSIRPALDLMTRQALVFDALIKPHHLDVLLAFADANPGLSIVLDHGGKPAIRDGAAGFAAWAPAVAKLALRPHITVKLSGLLTEATPGAGVADLAPFVDHLLTHFGPERVLWGSDWPVLELAAGYSDWVTITNTLIASLSADERAAVLGKTAHRIYRL